MKLKLQGGQFRWLNEKLYTTDSSQAVQLFKENPALFDLYHQGFRSQVQHWSTHPLDLFITELQCLPKTLVVADMGCGEGRLASSVDQTVYSFDLVALKPFITACDIKHVPLEQGSCDIVIFCLSLMGTNLKDFLKEAHRILKEKGVLKIAEVSSRLDESSFIKGVEACGFKIQKSWSPSKVFTMFNFKKTRKMGNAPLTLNPCLYKPRA